MKYTPFYDAHLAHNAKMVEFAGYSLPIHYGSLVDEHTAVRTAAGMFDVSHMVTTDVKGKDARAFLQRLIAGDVARLDVLGRALYAPLLHEKGGILDDLIVYRMNADETFYRIISNAATCSKDAAQFAKVAQEFEVDLTRRDDLFMLAVQGPKALEILTQYLDAPLEDLKPFHSQILDDDTFIARTGYTGEDGFEILADVSGANRLFNNLVEAGVVPCGLGARDTLRLEAGMNLYGHDMDEDTLPFECNMGWTLAIKDDREFVGKTALLQARDQKRQNQTLRTQIGVILEGRGVLREGMAILDDAGENIGIVTSGTHSPSLKVSLALAQVLAHKKDAAAFALIRDKKIPLRVVKPPFVRNGKALVDV